MLKTAVHTGQSLLWLQWEMRMLGFSKEFSNVCQEAAE